MTHPNLPPLAPPELTPCDPPRLSSIVWPVLVVVLAACIVGWACTEIFSIINAARLGQ